jgi:phosphohistidine phosphatase SixA
MLPAKVLVMRHAEKLDDPNDPNLSPPGQARAAAMVAWYPATFGRPDSIFATAISKHSERPIQTVQPLAQSLGIPFNATFSDQDYGALAKLLLSDTKFSGKSILICWHHGNIPGLLRALGASTGSYPDPWDFTVFDLVVALDYGAGKPPVASEITEPF